MNKFNFFLSDLPDSIQETDPLWGERLLVGRMKGTPEAGRDVKYGDYFKATEAFISENGFQRIISSIFQQSNILISQDKINNISVFLEKHGEYYHPSKVEVTTATHEWKFALNVAVSRAGLSIAKKEFELLGKLRREFPYEYIPSVYEYGQISNAAGSCDFQMFLGQWFSDFNEFHIHSIDHGGNCRVEVWDQKTGNHFLSEKLAYEIYRQTALIHTCYLNLKTSERIHPWHHAAGDFVVKIDGDQVQVKLVTARGYYPLVYNDENDIESLLEAALVFLSDLSVKNRIDRIKGVGDLVWASDIFVMATIDGFFKGLVQKALRNIISPNLVDHFGAYLSYHSESSIRNLFDDILATYPQESPELPLIKPRIDTHASIFYRFARHFFSAAATHP